MSTAWVPWVTPVSPNHWRSSARNSTPPWHCADAPISTRLTNRFCYRVLIQLKSSVHHVGWIRPPWHSAPRLSPALWAPPFTGTSPIVKQRFSVFLVLVVFIDKRSFCVGVVWSDGKTRNRLHIYRRVYCTLGATPDTNRSVGLHLFPGFCQCNP